MSPSESDDREHGERPDPLAVRGRDAALFALILLIAFALRFVHLGADPPQSLSSSNAEVMDGPWYLSDALDRARGHETRVADSYRRPLFTAAARVAFALMGPRLEAAHALAGASGLLLVLFGALGARSAFGTRTGLLAGLFLACSFVLTGYGRTPLIYGPLAAGLAAVFWVEAAAVRRLGAAGALAAAPLVLALTVGFKEHALAFAPALAVAALVAARARGRALIIASIVSALLAILLCVVWPEVPEHALAMARSYLRPDGASRDGASGGGWLEIAKRTLNAPVASGLAVKAPVLLALAWFGALVVTAPAPAETTEAPVARRERALEASVVAWLVSAILLFAPFRFEQDEVLIPIRHFAPALVPAAILAARALALLEDGVTRSLPRPTVFAFSLGAAYVGISLAWTLVLPVVDAGTREALKPFCTFFPLLGTALAAASLVTLGASGARPRSLKIGRRGARAAVALVLVSDALYLAPTLLWPTYTLKAANEIMARLLPRGAVVDGPFAHALTYEADVARSVEPIVRETPLEGRRSFTHLAVDMPRAERAERWFAAAGAPLTPIAELRVRTTSVRVYRFSWADEALSAGEGREKGHR